MLAEPSIRVVVDVALRTLRGDRGRSCVRIARGWLGLGRGGLLRGLSSAAQKRLGALAGRTEHGIFILNQTARLVAVSAFDGPVVVVGDLPELVLLRDLVQSGDGELASQAWRSDVGAHIRSFDGS